MRCNSRPSDARHASRNTLTLLENAALWNYSSCASSHIPCDEILRGTDANENSLATFDTLFRRRRRPRKSSASACERSGYPQEGPQLLFRWKAPQCHGSALCQRTPPAAVMWDHRAAYKQAVRKHRFHRNIVLKKKVTYLFAEMCGTHRIILLFFNFQLFFSYLPNPSSDSSIWAAGRLPHALVHWIVFFALSENWRRWQAGSLRFNMSPDCWNQTEQSIRRRRQCPM